MRALLETPMIVWHSGESRGEEGEALAVLCDAVSQVPPFFEPLVEEVFPKELTWVLTPFPIKLFRMRV